MALQDWASRHQSCTERFTLGKMKLLVWPKRNSNTEQQGNQQEGICTCWDAVEVSTLKISSGMQPLCKTVKDCWGDMIHITPDFNMNLTWGPSSSLLDISFRIRRIAHFSPLTTEGWTTRSDTEGCCQLNSPSAVKGQFLIWNYHFKQNKHYFSLCN